MGAGFDKDEGTGEAVLVVAVEDQRLRGAQANFAKIVEFQSVGSGSWFERGDIDAMRDLGDDRLRVERGVLEQEFARYGLRWVARFSGREPKCLQPFECRTPGIRCLGDGRRCADQYPDWQCPPLGREA